MSDQPVQEELVISPNDLVFYVDESGDERLSNRQHPVFAFGGVALVGVCHIEIARAWQKMKSKIFPQVSGPLHSKTHLKDRISEAKRIAVLSAMDSKQLGRFGIVITNQTLISPDQIMPVACGSLASRFATIAEGMIDAGLWKRPGRVIAVFEHSSRLAPHIEQQFTDLALKIAGQTIPLEGCFMPKSISNPFLEMADFVASTVGRNIKLQLENGRDQCNPNFQALFRDAGPPLMDYIEVTAAV